jgi:hypothetical protein
MGVLQMALQLMWVLTNKLHELQLIICTMQLIAIQLQFSKYNSFSTTIQLHYNYTHDVMLASLIVIHLGWKHGKIYTKSSVSNKILGSLKKRTNK